MQNAEFSPIVDTKVHVLFSFPAKDSGSARSQVFRYPRYSFTHAIMNSEESESESSGRDGNGAGLLADERTDLRISFLLKKSSSTRLFLSTSSRVEL